MSALMSESRQLINLAYRLLGSLADAEDVVQETYTRWYALSREQQAEIESPGAWLTTVASRICLDLLGSARVRREKYVGQWIPEPLPGGTEWIDERSGVSAVGPPDPADRVTLDESINMAFMVMLEAMTPAERVAFILHDVFRYTFAEVADIVGRTPAACRQLAVSARRHLQASDSVTPMAHRVELVRDFKEAWESKNLPALIGLLDPDATSIADGGGLVSQVFEAVEGGEVVARTFVEILGTLPGLELLERTVNGQPGLVAQQDGVTVAVLAFDYAGDRIKHVWAVRNPEKLRPWTWGLPIRPLAGERLVLEPLHIDHADEMQRVLDDQQLHTFVGGQPPANAEELRSRYARQVVGHSEDRSQRWLNWVVRRSDDGRLLGYVQATVSERDESPQANVAWVIGTAYQGSGYAQDAAALMAGWLRHIGVAEIVAYIHPDHHASNAIARSIGLAPTSDVVDEEVRWRG